MPRLTGRVEHCGPRIPSRRLPAIVRSAKVKSTWIRTQHGAQVGKSSASRSRLPNEMFHCLWKNPLRGDFGKKLSCALPARASHCSAICPPVRFAATQERQCPLCQACLKARSTIYQNPEQLIYTVDPREYQTPVPLRQSRPFRAHEPRQRSGSKDRPDLFFLSCPRFMRTTSLPAT